MIIAVDAASTIFLSYTVQYYPYYYFISADRSSTWTDNSGRFGGTNPTRSRMSFTAARRVAGGVSLLSTSWRRALSAPGIRSRRYKSICFPAAGPIRRHSVASDWRSPRPTSANTPRQWPHGWHCRRPRSDGQKPAAWRHRVKP